MPEYGRQIMQCVSTSRSRSIEAKEKANTTQLLTELIARPFFQWQWFVQVNRFWQNENKKGGNTEEALNAQIIVTNNNQENKCERKQHMLKEKLSSSTKLYKYLGNGNKMSWKRNEFEQ